MASARKLATGWNCCEMKVLQRNSPYVIEVCADARFEKLEQGKDIGLLAY